jgi:zinc protease
MVSDLRGQLRAKCFLGMATEGAWAKALATMEAQIAALDAAPPSENELEAAITKVRSDLRGTLFAQATRASSEIADQALTALLWGKTDPSPAERLRAFDVAVEDLTPADVQAAFRSEWTGAGPLVDVMAPAPPDAAVLKAAWLSSGVAAGPTAWPTVAWRYGDFGKAGRVVKREVVADSDYVRMTFANGVKLNFKHTETAKDSISLRVRFGQGRHGIAPADLYAANLGAVLMERGGMERNSYADVSSLFAEYGVQVQVQVLDEAFMMTATSSRFGVPINLQVMAAYATEPGFKDLDGVLPTIWKSTLRMIRGYPSMMVSPVMIDGVAPDNPSGLAAAGAAENLTSADLARALKPDLTGSPLELTVVGDIDERDAVAAVASTFGALPPRKPALPRADAWFLRFPEHPPALIVATHTGPPEKAAVALVWPLYVAEPARRREEYALLLVSQVYQDALLRRIRGELSKTYSPSAGTTMPDHADQGYLLATAEVSAGDADQTRAEMTAIAGKIARGDFTDQDIENVRKPYLASLAKTLASNDAWADSLHSDSGDETELADMRRMVADIGSITPAEVRKAAADWLTPAPITVVVTGKPAAAPASTPAKP